MLPLLNNATDDDDNNVSSIWFIDLGRYLVDRVLLFTLVVQRPVCCRSYFRAKQRWDDDGDDDDGYFERYHDDDDDNDDDDDDDDEDDDDDSCLNWANDVFQLKSFHSSILTAGAAVGVSCIFGTPIGGEVKNEPNNNYHNLYYLYYFCSTWSQWKKKWAQYFERCSVSFIHSWISFIFIINANKGNENCENELTFSRHNVQCRSNGNQLRHGEFLERFVCLHVRSNNFGILQVFGKKSR